MFVRLRMRKRKKQETERKYPILLHFHNALQGLLLCICCKPVGVKSFFCKRSHEISRADRVHCDSFLAPFCRKSSCHIDNAAFCSMIRRTCCSHISHKTVHRGNIDNTSVVSFDHFFCIFTSADE